MSKFTEFIKMVEKKKKISIIACRSSKKGVKSMKYDST